MKYSYFKAKNSIRFFKLLLWNLFGKPWGCCSWVVMGLFFAVNAVHIYIYACYGTSLFLLQLTYTYSTYVVIVDLNHSINILLFMYVRTYIYCMYILKGYYSIHIKKGFYFTCTSGSYSTCCGTIQSKLYSWDVTNFPGFIISNM